MTKGRNRSNKWLIMCNQSGKGGGLIRLAVDWEKGGVAGNVPVLTDGYSFW